MPTVSDVVTSLQAGNDNAASATTKLSRLDSGTLAQWLRARGITAPDNTRPATLAQLVVRNVIAHPRLATEPVSGDGPAPPAPPELPKPPQPTEDQAAAEQYALANVKVVFWIPDAVEPAAWSALAGSVEGFLLQYMLGTGNPDPPSAFPTAAAYQAFVATKEYRAIMDFDMLVCKRGGAIHDVRAQHAHLIGYTHEHSSPWIRDDPSTLPPVADVFQRGNLRVVPEDPRIVAGRGYCDPRLSLQVNSLDAAGWRWLSTVSNGDPHVLPYMWLQLQTAIAPDGTLTTHGVGSAVPSKALYVNNKQVAVWNMLACTLDEIRQSVSNVGGSVFNPSAAPDAVPLPPTTPLLDYTEVEPFAPGCPDEFPDGWLYRA